MQQEVVLTILAREKFHLKLIAAAVADPLTIVDTQRRELLRRLRDARAVDGVDLDIGAGETVAIMGPSGTTGQLGAFVGPED